ncbi:uncharacterized protein J8A68_003199 [[Candida] subhashii]|uniref:AB hydrolase-1 domain-containing protein n=1 Tax=[Candida] subhashii TaxID=561895 RepID=A0A8J5QMT4_9ASCO|nr:uncharacterized protein J8A68_003199 [[Candida] subhashii]KAG7663285.1 hypothetical protein J8A68_003199 [[Candida] subhashii]
MSFTVEKKVGSAYPYRAAGSTILAEDTHKLKLVYNKYKTTLTPPTKDTLRFNLIFCHGTGFNKSIWKYHIKKLYELSQQRGTNWFLDSVMAIDFIGHGDSSLLNNGLLGPVYRWDEGGKDITHLIKQEISSTGDFQNNFESRNIVIGHSMGGFSTIYAAFHEPTLIDSIVPIEPVYYGEPDRFTKFKKIFNKISQMIIDKFDSIEDLNYFFKKFSFYKNMTPEIMKDYMDDEVIEEIDPETNEKVYKIKCIKRHQMTAYFGSFTSIARGMHVLPTIQVPIYHVIGAKAVWNPPASIPWIRGNINPKYLAGTFDIPEGEHLCNVEKPDETIDIIAKVLTERNSKYTQERVLIPEIVKNKDRQVIADEQFSKMFDLKFDDIYGYILDVQDRPAHSKL